MAVPENKTISVIVHKLPRRGFISITGLINSKNISPAKKYSGHVFFFYEFQNKRSVTVIDLTEMVPPELSKHNDIFYVSEARVHPELSKKMTFFSVSEAKYILSCQN